MRMLIKNWVWYYLNGIFYAAKKVARKRNGTIIFEKGNEKMKAKRTLALLLALVMLIGMLPTLALADTTTTLPAEVVADLQATGAGVAHAHAYGADDFYLSSMTRVEDSDSVLNDAAKKEDYDTSKDLTVTRYAGAETVVGTIPASELAAIDGQGYKTYKFADITLPDNGSAEDKYFLYMFGWGLQTRKMVNELSGKTVDVYVSVKVDGTTIYVDQIIAVDACDDYGVTGAVWSEETGKYMGTCDYCGETAVNESIKAKVPASIDVKHVLGDYVADNGLYRSGSSTTRVDDADATLARAIKVTGYTGAASGLKFQKNPGEAVVGTVTAEELAANGGEYKLYKFENVTLPDNGAAEDKYYLYSFG